MPKIIANNAKVYRKCKNHFYEMAGKKILYILVGYGNIVPTTEVSKLFCVFYTLVGVPLLFLSLTNIGQFLAEGYWIFLASLSRSQVPYTQFRRKN